MKLLPSANQTSLESFHRKLLRHFDRTMREPRGLLLLCNEEASGERSQPQKDGFTDAFNVG
jgi:hypothetical protein